MRHFRACSGNWADARFTDAASLIRFHEALLFYRAYPPNPEVLELADAILPADPEENCATAPRGRGSYAV